MTSWRPQVQSLLPAPKFFSWSTSRKIGASKRVKKTYILFMRKGIKMDTNTTVDAQPNETPNTRLPKRGDILMGRPLFHSDEGEISLSHMHHPVVVLAVAQRDADGPVLAMVVPMTHCLKSHSKPNHLPLQEDQVYRFKAHPGKTSHICTDSPNIVVLNSEDNGLKKQARVPDWVSPYTYGRIRDKDALDAAESLTRCFIAQTQYHVPIQGSMQRDAAEKPEPVRRKMGTEVPLYTRIAIVSAAAKSIANEETLRKLGPALIKANLRHKIPQQSVAH